MPHLAAGVDWRERAEPYRKAIEARLMETVLPGLSDVVVSSRLMTPLDFRDRYLSPFGAGFGLEPILTQSAYLRPQNKSHWLDNLSSS